MFTSWTPWRRLIQLWPLCLGALAACSTIDRWLGITPKTELRQVQVLALPHANQGLATVLDLVFVFDTAAVPLLPATSRDWFDKKAQILAGLGTSVQVLSSDYVTPSLTPATALSDKLSKVVAVYAFVNYNTPQARADLSHYVCVRIELQAQLAHYQTCP